MSESFATESESEVSADDIREVIEEWLDDLAIAYERGVEVFHPQYITSAGKCVCLTPNSGEWCLWSTSTVKYYRYNGSRDFSSL